MKKLELNGGARVFDWSSLFGCDHLVFQVSRRAFSHKIHSVFHVVPSEVNAKTGYYSESAASTMQLSIKPKPT